MLSQMSSSSSRLVRARENDDNADNLSPASFGACIIERSLTKFHISLAEELIAPLVTEYTKLFSNATETKEKAEHTCDSLRASLAEGKLPKALRISTKVSLPSSQSSFVDKADALLRETEKKLHEITLEGRLAYLDECSKNVDKVPVDFVTKGADTLRTAFAAVINNNNDFEDELLQLVKNHSSHIFLSITARKVIADKLADAEKQSKLRLVEEAKAELDAKMQDAGLSVQELVDIAVKKAFNDFLKSGNASKVVSGPSEQKAPRNPRNQKGKQAKTAQAHAHMPPPKAPPAQRTYAQVDGDRSSGSSRQSPASSSSQRSGRSRQQQRKPNSRNRSRSRSQSRGPTRSSSGNSKKKGHSRKRN
jgi:hypothetical protein